MVGTDPERIVVRMVHRTLGGHGKAGRRVHREEISAECPLAQGRNIPSAPAHVQPMGLGPGSSGQRDDVVFNGKERHVYPLH